MITTEEMLQGTEVTGTPIQEFYHGSTILITGGTGFMGKVLLQKLLRTCPGINTVYLLIRSKKGKDVEKRMDEIFEDVVFSKLKEEVPKFRHKVFAVSGDCSLPKLGLSAADRQMLSSEVDIVFHGAATVRFDEKIQVAVAINVSGTKNILELARSMPKLKAIAHISTAFCHCPRKDIDEKFYNTPISYHKIMDLVESCSDKTLEEITPSLLGDYPNTYVFTKALAEEVVQEECQGLPLTVFRPAIVVGTRNDPVQGWIDNLYGPTGVMVGAGVGLLKTLNCNEKCIANIVPVDMAVNALIASVWDIACNNNNNNNKNNNKGDKTTVPIYNYVSSCDQPLSWGEFMNLAMTHGMAIPTIRSIWYYSFRLTKNRLLYLVQVLFLHFLPALLVDTVIVLARGKPKMLKVVKKVHRFSDVIAYFSLRDWDFTNKNLHALWDRLSDEDRSLYDFDMRTLNWDEFFYGYLRGVRVHLMKDDLSTVPQAKIRWRRLYWLHQGVKLVLALLALQLLRPVLSYIAMHIFT
ncbi:fatty acyl-CoA reductase wat [Anabrus simplex]|uniref:fatty acyl-CoA reductase wat n=1 Tax=Anabrus simplex TaxID=316456 RepID=UPI0035A264DF